MVIVTKEYLVNLIRDHQEFKFTVKGDSEADVKSLVYSRYPNAENINITFLQVEGTNYLEIKSLKELIRVLSLNHASLNIFVGADCSGKDYVIDKCSESLQNWGVFKPDYLNWTAGDIKDRWRFFQYALRIISTSNFVDMDPILIDRSSLCGAVYNNQLSIALEYKKLLKGISNLHILIVPDTPTDYRRFQKQRSHFNPNDELLDYQEAKTLMVRYKDTLDLLGLPYIVFRNKFKEEGK